MENVNLKIELCFHWYIYVQKTDITQSALEALSKSRVRRVYLVGRRGPLQVAFTTAELREMLRLPNTSTILSRPDFEGLEPKIKG